MWKLFAANCVLNLAGAWLSVLSNSWKLMALQLALAAAMGFASCATKPIIISIHR